MDIASESFLCVAKTIIDSQECGRCNSAVVRTSLSRAYYAIFHTAISLFRKAGKPMLANVNAHRFLIELMKKSSIPKLVVVGREMADFRDKRNSADYWDEHFDINDIDIDDELSKAEKAVEMIDSVKNTPSELTRLRLSLS